MSNTWRQAANNDNNTYSFLDKIEKLGAKFVTSSQQFSAFVIILKKNRKNMVAKFICHLCTFNIIIRTPGQ